MPASSSTTGTAGQRVRLVTFTTPEMSAFSTDLVPGDEGTILFTDSQNTVHVRRPASPP